MKNTIIAVAAIAVLGVGGWYVYTKGGPTDSAVATVNGEDISRSDFDKLTTQIYTGSGIDPASTTPEMQSQVKQQAIDSLINQELLSQAADRAGVAPPTAEVDAQLETLKSQLGGEENFAQALLAQGLNEAEFRERLSEDLTIRTYLEAELQLSSIMVTEDEIKALYDSAAQGGDVPPLSDVHEQVKQAALQQKQQTLVATHVAELKAAADIKILI